MKDDKLYLIHIRGINIVRVWEIIASKLPELKQSIEAVLDELGA